MPPLKDVLVKQAGVLGNLEKKLPVGAPRVSQLMVNVAETLPVNPVLPELPIGPGMVPQPTEAVANIIKGIERPSIIEAGVSGEPILTAQVISEEIIPSPVGERKIIEARGF